jgi:hypothetical protein
MHRSTMPEFLRAVSNADQDATRCVCCHDAVLVRVDATFVTVADYVCTRCRALGPKAEGKRSDAKGTPEAHAILVNTDISPRNGQN